MSGMVRTGAPIILPRSELTLHRAPPTRPARTRSLSRSPLKPVHEEWSGGRTLQRDSNATPTASSTLKEIHRSSSTVRRGEYSPTSTMSSFRYRQGTTTTTTTATTSRTSSLARALRNHSRPLYRQARTRMRAARRWANNFRRRIKTRSGVPLLTPARSRRGGRPVLVVASPPSPPQPPICRPFPSAECSSSPRFDARNSPRVLAANRAASAAREVRWEAASGLGALLECGRSAGSAAVRLCTAVVAMADARLQQLRRSISSWSLSTVKKPKITIPKLRTPSLNLFTGRKRNRVNPKDEEAATEDVKLALLKLENEDGLDKVGGGRVIHEPQKATGETHPTIVLTVHDHSGTSDPQPPSPNPGLLAPNDDIEYIDSDEGEDDRFVRGTLANADYSDQWFDCKGTLTRSHNDLSKVGVDYDECPASTYYEATEIGTKKEDDQPIKVIPKDSTEETSKVVLKDNEKERSPEKSLPTAEEKKNEEIVVKPADDIKGSQKARAWVQSLEEDTERRLEKWIELQKSKNSSDLPKSKSEIRLDSLDDPLGKWSARNEIKLNAPVDDEAAYEEYLQTYNAKAEQKGDPEKDDAARRESLKRVFQVRGKLSNKTIIDSQRPSYKDTDIYIASTPFALTNSSSGQEDSHDESEDGINCISVDFEPALELSKGTADLGKFIGKAPNSGYDAKHRSTCNDSPVVMNEPAIPKVPDIIINAPDVESDEPDTPREEEGLNTSISDDYRYSSPSTENTENTVEESTLSEEVVDKKAHIREIQNQDLELYENEVITNAREMEDVSDAISSDNAEATKKDSRAKDLNITISEVDVPSDLQKPNRKKKKISASSIPKSIKNLAGSIFSQQNDSKPRKEQSDEKNSERQKRRSRLSPFNKDYLFKSSSKSKTSDDSSDKNIGYEELNDSEKISVKDNSDAKDTPHQAIVSDKTSSSVHQSSPEVQLEFKYSKKVDNKTVTPDIPSSDSMKSIHHVGRGSSESLEYISPIDSDEQKSISHESSPGIGNPFVEEDGLLIRKDALLAVKRMENDDTSTHYYSFLSAADDAQLPAKELELPPVSEKIDIVQPLREISVFHEPLRNTESAKFVPGTEETPSVCISDRSSSNAGSSSESTLKSSIQSQEANCVTKISEKPKSKSIPTPEKPTVKIYEVEGHSPLCTPSPFVKEPVPVEVTKLGLPASGSQEPPKPSPRTKKGRYGYSTASSTPTTPTAPLNTAPKKEVLPCQISCVSLNSNVGVTDNTRAPRNITAPTFPKEKGSIAPTHKVETERNSSDSGYVGPGNNYYDSEPIYWEISETKDAPPRPSPRGKKGQRTPSEQSLITAPISKPVTVTTPAPVSLSPTTVPKAEETYPLPEWINKRAPIPSPRTKKQRSLQSLPTVVPSDDTMETVKKKLQSMSSVPISSTPMQQRVPVRKNKAEEQFYSGKAASISYGFTSDNSLPSPPVRGKKASQVSLPAAVAVEESVSKQEKRASLHEFGLNRNLEKGAAPRPPSVKRSRRRTDPTYGITASALKTAVEHFGTNLMNLTDLLVAVGIGSTSAKKTEEHLCGVLYSVYSLMGATGGGTWTVSSAPSKDPSAGTTGPGHDKKNVVTLAQVTKELKEAYQISNDAFNKLVDRAKIRPTPEVQLHVSVKEAKDLRPKTVLGKANSYATVVIPSTGDTHRTRVQKNTLDPIWNQDFVLRVNNLQKDVLKLEIWHEHDAVGVQQLTAVRDIKSFGRLVKGTTQQAKHQGSHLLGKVVLNIKSMSEEGPDGWYPLEKDGEPSKERGVVRLEGKVVSTAELDHEGRKSYDALLTRLAHHEISLPSINNEADQWTPPWNGRLSSPATAALAQHAIMLGISDAQLQLSWWLVGCRVATVDAAWALSQLHRVQLALAKGLYEVEELAELRSSLSYFVRAHTERLKDLHTAFPSSSGVLAQSQLTYTLKALYSLQTHAASRQLLDQEMIPHIHELVTSSINTHAKNWWTLLVEEQLRGVKTADEQISRVIKIVDEANIFLHQATVFYNAVFLKEMNIPYMQTTYLMVSKKINPCVRPLLMNIYNRMPSVQDQEEMGAETNLQYGLEVGTSLWQLYRNLGRLHSLSEGLAPEARSESGIREYHRWFSRGVMRWLELAIWRAQDMIKKAVELDSFETVDDFCDFSSSATDTTGIFHDVKIWWLKLMWPDPEHSAVLLARILEDICSCATTYSDLLRAKVDKMFQGQANTDRIFITKQICVGLNNIERVRRELTGLPGHFGFDDTLDEIRRSINGEGPASQLEATVERLIVSATENMEAKVNEFIEAVIYRFKPTLDRALQEACETQSEAPLLEQVMDPAIQLLHNNLHASNFQRFLWYLWEVLITLFSETVDRNIERRKASYFKGVYDLLEASLKFFSPDEGIGLDPEEARTKEYTELLDFLDSLRMSTESLIAKYYQERHDEQSETAVPSKAQLVVKMLFTRPGKLLVEVIMARDMVVDSDTMSVSSKTGGLHSFYSQPVDSYVKVQLIPQEWFPSATVRKTKTQRKADPAVYEETFEYDMKKDNDGVCAGLLLFTLKDYNLGRSNTFIGEAVVPLTDLPCVDSSQVHTVPNTYLKMTTPGLDMGYKSLRALQRRTGDKVASSFLKKVSKRLPETRLKTPQKPDDERGRPRSPNLIDRFKFT